jgi:hypothetical protein
MFTPLSQCLILLAGSVFLVTLARRLALPASAAYLVVGLLLGPHALAVLADSGTTRLLADLGVAFLLFTLGLEFSLPRMIAMRGEVFVLGASQVLLTTTVFAVIGNLLGVPWLVAVVLGGAVSMSSTAILLQQLTERSELNRTHGRLAFSMLLFQDLAFVPFLALASVLIGGTAQLGLGASVVPVLGGMLAIIAVLAAGRWLLRPLFHVIAHSRLGFAQRGSVLRARRLPLRDDAGRDRVPPPDRVGDPSVSRHSGRPVLHLRGHAAGPAPARPSCRAARRAPHPRRAGGAQGAAGRPGHLPVRALALQGAAHRHRDVDRG